ncbi:MAG: type II toxin-antitoxin system RelE/ParE family toxin [Cytophagales bacterium]|nr:type II toxin-antitoxin system RelE/ParE family toxin [Cytophagales bacterium]
MQVFVTPRAEKNFLSIVEFIKGKWGERTAKQFAIKTDETFKLLKNFPEMGQVEKDDIRGFQLSPQTRILYRIKADKIIVLAFFDVRQDPNKKFK